MKTREIPAEEVDIGLDDGDGALGLHQREIIVGRGEPLHRIRAEPDAEIVRRILDSGRQRGRAHDCGKIVGELSFVRPRAERRLHDQHGGAGGLGGARERSRFAQVRSGDRRHERRPAGDILDRPADDCPPLRGAEGADLGHEAEHGDAMRARRDDRFDLLPEGAAIERAALVEERVEHGEDAAGPCMLFHRCVLSRLVSQSGAAQD